MKYLVQQSKLSRWRQRALALLLATVLLLADFSGILGWWSNLAVAPTTDATVGINRQITYQGRLADSAGNSVASGNYNFLFQLYNDPDGGTLLWEEAWTATTSPGRVNIANGTFSVNLGTSTSLSTVDFNSDALFLQVYFDAGGDGNFEESFSPRKRITAAPYAFNADTVDGFHASSTATADQLLALDANAGLTVNGATTTDSLSVGGYASSTGGLFTLGNLHVGGTSSFDGLVSGNGFDQGIANYIIGSSTIPNIGGCTAGQVVEWNGSTFICSTDNVGAGGAGAWTAIENAIYNTTTTDTVLVGTNVLTDAGNALEVSGPGYFTGNLTVLTAGQFNNVTTTDSLSVGGYASSTSLFVGVNGQTTTSTTLYGGLLVDATTLVVNANENRVGIGTLNPTALFHVAGSAQFNNVSTTDTLYVGGTASSTGGLFTQGNLHVGGTSSFDGLISGTGFTNAWNNAFNTTTTWASFGTNWNSAFNNTTTWSAYDTNWARNFNTTTTWAGFNNAFDTRLNATTTLDLTTLDVANLTVNTSLSGTGFNNAFDTRLIATTTWSGNLTVDGNIGINTSTPNYKLVVNATNGTDNLLQVATTTNQNIFVIDKTGNTIFGGTASSTGGLFTQGNLHVGGTASFDGLISGTGFTNAWNNAFNTTTTWASFGTNWNSSFNNTTTWSAYDTNWARNFNATTTWAGFNNAFDTRLNATTTLDLTTLAVSNLTVNTSLSGTGFNNAFDTRLIATTTWSGNLTVDGFASSTNIWTAGTLHVGGAVTFDTALAVTSGGTGATTAAAARTNLGLVIGTNVQAWDNDLDDIAALTPSDGSFIVGDGADWVTESGATARTSLGLGTTDSVRFNNVTTTDSLSVGGYASSTSLFVGVNGQTTTSTTLYGGLLVDATTLVVNANENRVGIGTANPKALLSLGNAVQTNKLLLYDADNVAKYGFGIASSLMQIYAATTGRLGFGSYDGTTFTENVTISNTTAALGVATTTPGGTYSERLTVVGGIYGTTFGQFNNVSTTDSLYVGGKVGIGTTTPTGLLHIDGTGDAATGEATFRVYTSASETATYGAEIKQFSGNLAALLVEQSAGSGTGRGLVVNSVAATGNILEVQDSGSIVFQIGVNGAVFVEGSGAGIVIDDRTTGTNWQLYGATTFNLYNGSANIITVSTAGAMTLGINDTTGGTLGIYGNGASSNEGGQLDLHLAADHDTTFQNWSIDANQDDLRIFSSDAVALHYFTAGGGMTLDGNLVNANTTMNIGVSDDIDLLGLAVNVLTVNGTATSTVAINTQGTGHFGGAVSVDGLMSLGNNLISADTDIDIGVNADGNLLNLTTGVVTIDGDLRVDGFQIGITTDTDLLSLAVDTLTVNGAASTTKGFQAASTLYVYESGRVGLGTATPGYRLSVVSNNATDALFQVATTTNTGIMVIDKFGKVGIDDASPDGRLDIIQTGYGQTGYGLIVETADNARNLLAVRSGHTTDSLNGIYMVATYADTVGVTNRDLFIDNTGKIGYVSSALKYKENVMNMADTSWLYNLRPVNFNYIDEIDPYKQKTNQYGLVAEEVEVVNPDFVFYNKNGELEGVHYSRFIAVIINELQQHESRLNSLAVSQATTTSTSELTVTSDPDYQIATLRVTQSAEFTGTIIVRGEAGFESRVVFKGEVELAGPVYFNADTAGVINLPAGATSTEVLFTNEYKWQPIITVTPRGNLTGRNYWVTEETVKGFRIAIEPVLAAPLEFNWHAIAVKDGAVGVVAGATVIAGCSDPTATNYNGAANEDDGSCQYNQPAGGSSEPAPAPEPSAEPTPEPDATPELAPIIEAETISTPVPELIPEPTPVLPTEPVSEPESAPAPEPIPESVPEPAPVIEPAPAE